MADLVERNLELASAGPRIAPSVAERETHEEPVQVAAALPPTRPAASVEAASTAADDTTDTEEGQEAAPAPLPAPVAVEKPRLQVVAVASLGPMQLVPAPVAAPAARPRPAVVSGAPRGAAITADQTASIGVKPERKRIIVDGSTGMQPAASAYAATTTPTTLHWIAGPAPAAGRAATSKPLDTRLAKLAAPIPPTAQTLRAATAGRSVVARAEPAPAPAPAATRSGWVIQIGATDDAGKANELLSRARLQDRIGLAAATAFTEKVQRGEATLYRARFAGLEPDQAEAACKSLKRSGFDCFATKN
jgi:D-alanyl-D-alanine carboxypeptidase